jgi:hypothetical protein
MATTITESACGKRHSSEPALAGLARLWRVGGGAWRARQRRRCHASDIARSQEVNDPHGILAGMLFHSLPATPVQIIIVPVLTLSVGRA